MRPLVKWTSSRICVISSQPTWRKAGVMNLVQMSRSLRLFLSMVTGLAGFLAWLGPGKLLANA